MTARKPNAVAAVAPLWVQPVRWASVLSVEIYYRLAYRIRGWGGLPRKRGATLVVGNHQHDIESAIIVSDLAIGSFSWRWPVFTVSSRRMWERGFMASRIQWARFALRGINFGPLFSSIGLQPIENDLHARPFVSFAQEILKRHEGGVALADVFRERALERLPSRMRTVADVLRPENFVAGREIATLSELREPYRNEMLAATRQQLENDLNHFEQLQRDGATIFLMPEGIYSGDGKMQRLRGVLPRIAPHARIWILGISFDPFASRRLSMLYRVLPSVESVPLDIQMKRTRPVTVSALLGTWLHGKTQTFYEREAIDAIAGQLSLLPADLFVDPELASDPQKQTRKALATMSSLGIIARGEDGYRLTENRALPSFPQTRDMVEYQFNFHQETLEGAHFEQNQSATRSAAV